MRIRLGCGDDLEGLVRFGKFPEVGCKAW